MQVVILPGGLSVRFGAARWNRGRVYAGPGTYSLKLPYVKEVMNQEEINREKKIELRPVRGPRTKVRMPDGKEHIPLGSGIITGFLGEGGMANVYEIWNSQLEVHHAVKLINPNCSDDAKERFKTEIKICAKLHHPNIIEIYGVGKWNDLPYLEMEKIDGVTLNKMIRRRGALPPAVCTAIGIMIGRALKYAHNQDYVIYGNTYHGVIHRDLKPSNIMLNRNGSVRLMDFGIASPTEASFHTMEGTVLGNLQYLSPEQLEGKKLDIRTDIYSLGVVMYEIVCGHLAFPEANVHKLMMDKLKSRFKPLEEYDIGVPGRLRRLIYRAMQHDRRSRIPDAVALLAELDKVHRSFTHLTPEKVMSEFMGSADGERNVARTRRRFPVRMTAAAVVVLLLGIVLHYSYDGMRRRTRTFLVSLVSSSQPPVPESAQNVQVPVPEPTQLSREHGSGAAGSAPAPAQAAPRPASQQQRRGSAAPPLPPPPPALTLVERLAQRHGVDDPVELMVRELRSGNHRNVAALYEGLDPRRRESTKAGVFMLRSLVMSGSGAALADFLASRTVDDGEYWLARAKLAWERGNVDETLRMLARGEATRREFIDSQEFRREVQYYRALCATRRFDSEPTEEHYRSAVEHWHELRTTLREYPEHRYNAIIVGETQRIGQKYRSSRG